MATSAPVFSYAQAAKGQSTKHSTIITDSSSTPSKLSNDAPDTAHEIDQIQENQDLGTMTPLEEPKEATNSPSSPTVADTSTEPLTSGKSQSSESGKVTTPPKDKESTSSSPSLTANVTHSVLKEDDVFGTPHESDATWEKVSQESQLDDGSHKIEGDGDDSKLSTWEEIPPPQLKEAPLPTVNVWQKRAMELSARAKEHRPASHFAQQEKSSTNNDLPKNDIKRRTEKGSVSMKESKSAGFEGQSQQRSPRSPDSPKSQGLTVPPPPPSDATSWPTPNLAKEEDKKKTQDRPERPDKTPGRAQRELKWEKVDYVPTAVFNTPLPSRGRGGRIGGRGGRDMGRGGQVNATERAVSGSNPSETGSSTVQPSERKTGDVESGKSGPVSRQRRSASAGPASSREQRRGVDGAQDRRDDNMSKHSHTSRAYDNRRVSVSTQTDNAPPIGQQSTLDAQKRTPIPPDFSGDYASPVTSDRRFDARARDYNRETNGWYNSRERGDRADRGRSSWRGKGGHSNYGGHSMSNQNGQGFSQNNKSYGYGDQRHNSQSHPSFSNARESRHGRTASRSQSIANPSPYAKYPANMPPSGPHQLPNLHTDMANMYGYQHGPPAIMSAMPYNPYMDNNQLQGMVQMQLDYYFSLDNLCKDLWLRKNMDAQGFVFLTLIQNFNRIRQLTNDYDLIRYSCYKSTVIELRTGTDGLDRIRKAGTWKDWVLPKEDRDASVQDDSPPDLYSPQFGPYPIYNSFDGAHAPNQSNPLSPRDSFSLNGNRAEPLSVDDDGPVGQASDPTITQTPLSAAVPDFQPSSQGFNAFYYNAFVGTAEQRDMFSDEAIDNLNIVVRRPNPVGHQAEAIVNHSGPRGVNGNLDANQNPRIDLDVDNPIGISIPTAGEGHPIQDEDINGAQSPQVSDKALINEGSSAVDISPVIWAGNGNQPAIDDESESMAIESYPRFRLLALRERQEVPLGHCPRNMEILYQFWSHFLVKNFNMSMYEEFRRTARNDVDERGSIVGVTSLAEFYNGCLRDEQLIISDRLLTDLRDLVKSEAFKPNKPAFDKLKLTWKLGSFDMPNRFRLAKILDDQLKTELDR